MPAFICAILLLTAIQSFGKLLLLPMMFFSEISKPIIQRNHPGVILSYPSSDRRCLAKKSLNNLLYQERNNILTSDESVWYDN